jgi:hypothetical protein
MQTVYVGNTLINDIMLGSQRMDDVLENSSLYIDYLVVAGGGASGADNGGGGGGGGVLTGSLYIPVGTTFQTIVGLGGTGSTAPYRTGKNSKLGPFESFGGGAGGTNAAGGENGGSGGGGGGYYTTGINGGGTGTAGPPRQGYNGSDSGGPPAFPPNPVACGAGGGAASAASGTTGGSGLVWVDAQTYGKGGNGTGDSAGSGYGWGGNGGNGIGAANNGGTGIVIIRYKGPVKATGGDSIQTFADGNTFHYFTNVATSSFSYP